MNPATDGAWTGGYSGQAIDGVDMWEAITTGADSPRTEVVHVIGDGDDGFAALVMGNYKFFKGANDPNATTPDFVFAEDLNPGNVVQECSNPTPFFDVEEATKPRGASAATAVASRTFGGVIGTFTFFALFVFFAGLTVYSRRLKGARNYVGGDMTFKYEVIE
jgi:hypothetical protein